jgi:hypothetical protein
MFVYHRGFIKAFPHAISISPNRQDLWNFGDGGRAACPRAHLRGETVLSGKHLSGPDLRTKCSRKAHLGQRSFSHDQSYHSPISDQRSSQTTYTSPLLERARVRGILRSSDRVRALVGKSSMPWTAA